MARTNILFFVALMAAGCVGDLIDLSKRDGGAVPMGDGGGQPGTDGATVGATFDPVIQQDVDTIGCSAGACHGGTAPMHQVCAPHQLPMVTIGAGDPEVRAHAPNESYDLELMRRAAKVTGRFLQEFAAIES